MGNEKRNDSDPFGTLIDHGLDGRIERIEVGAGDTATNKAWRAAA